MKKSEGGVPLYFMLYREKVEIEFVSVILFYF